MSLAALLAVLGSFTLLGFTVVGYPALVRLRARDRRAPGDVALELADAVGMMPAPHVTAIVATRDDPAVVRVRVENLRAMDYPAGRMDVVVAIDARASHPWTDYAAAVAGLATVVAGDPPGGKACALNAAVRVSRGDVLLFADSRQQFTPNTVRDLVASLAGERVGAVSGMVVSAKDDGLMDRYWTYELELRRRQAAIHSIICVSGAVYALRRELWVPMPAALICDDLFVTLGLVVRGWRVGFCERAHAIDPRQFTREEHFDRKVRTLTGLLQLCAWMPPILVPWRNGIWVDFALHKLMRIVFPYLAIVGALGALWLMVSVLGAATTAWLALAALVALGAVFALRPRVLGALGWALRLFTAPMLAVGNALRARWEVWPSRHATTPQVAAPPTAVRDADAAAGVVTETVR